MGWNEILNKETSSTGNKSDVKYASLKAGTHLLRIVDTEPYSRWTHWVPTANNGKGLTIDCLGKGCPVCDIISKEKKEGKKPRFNSRKMHAINVIYKTLGSDNKPTGDIEMQIVDKGNSLFESLAGLLAEVGDLKTYDIKIRVTGEGTDTAFTPIPMPPKELTQAEKDLPLYDFAKLYPKLTQQQVIDLVAGKTYADIFATTDAQDDTLEVDFTR